jgi:hypothetical protein
MAANWPVHLSIGIGIRVIFRFCPQSDGMDTTLVKKSSARPI